MEAQSYRLYSSLADFSSLKKWVEIDLEALRSNYRVLRAQLQRRAPMARMIAVVKADAYGHGAPACVDALLHEGCDFFAVSCIEEAVSVRMACEKAGVATDILILGYTDPSMAQMLHMHGLTQALLSEHYAAELAMAAEAIGVTLRVHVAVDTGMNRIGFSAHNDAEIEGSSNAILCVSGRSGLEITGMFTHFAQADEAADAGERTTRLQIERYLALKDSLEAHGLRIPFHHISNSAAFVIGEAPILDGVRVGIVLYGAQPALHRGLRLLPVMRLKASIVHTNILLPGEHVSYGGEFSAETKRRLAVLPVGYADGFLRAYRSAKVVVHTATGAYRVPVVGRICMDQCMIDITDTDAAVGDAVTLFGEDGITADTLASCGGSIDYETLCLISARVMRCYKE